MPKTHFGRTGLLGSTARRRRGAAVTVGRETASSTVMQILPSHTRTHSSGPPPSPTRPTRGIGMVDVQKGSCLNEQGAEVFVASFRKPTEFGFATRRVLFGNKTKPGGKIPPLFEGTTIANGTNNGTRYDHADTRYCH